jgi:DNA-binding IclR family transcriptional regulator
VESTEQVLRRAATIGESTPLTTGSSGLAILAHLDAAETEEIIAKAGDPAALRVTLREARQAGYVLSFGANHPGVHGIAAPVLSTFATDSGVSVALSGPADRWTEHRMRAFSARLLDTCAELSALFADTALQLA